MEKLAEEGIVNNKKDDEDLQQFRDSFVKFTKTFNQTLMHLAPHLDNGVEIVRGSFNYYTVNKFATEDFEQKLTNVEEKFLRPYRLENADTDEKFLREIGFPFDVSKLSIADLYKELKIWKANEKAKFNEAVSKGNSLDNLKKTFPIFKKHKALESFLKFTKEINFLSNQFNQNKSSKFKKELDIKKKKRGELFMRSWGFSEWVDYCEIFKKVAVAVGKLKAEKRSIEQSIAEARLLQYWSLIVKTKNEYELLLVYRTKMIDFKKELDNFISPNVNDGKQIIELSSLTLRALEKLIRKNLSKEVLDLADDKKAIALYKKVLNGDFNNKINLEAQSDLIKQIKYGGLLTKNFSTIEEFRVSLEEFSYLQKTYSVTEWLLTKWRNEYGLISFKLDSYDFTRNITGNKKDHTKLWENYWGKNNISNNFTIRLNPEIRIFYRPKREQKEEAKQKNRFSKDHYGVAFTFTENAGGSKIINSFKESKEQKLMIEKFNQEVINSFIKEKGDNLWYYGIDRGQTELATLCVVKFSQEEYSAILKDDSVKKFLKPIPANLELWKIKEDCLLETTDVQISKSTGKNIKFTCWKNPSYFLDKNILEKVEGTCIDLTTAKLIKGKIVLNGDMATYLALKRANGKRQLFNKFANIDPNSIIFFDENKNQFKVKSNSKISPEVFLPFWNDNLSKVISREEFREELQEYLNELRTNKNGVDSVSIEQINHLRDAITANMVGIISYLFETFPGIINLENLLSTSEIKKHFEDNNENISRRLEWSLYKKFQKRGLVPPKLKDTVFQKENNMIKNFGVIRFVPTEETSSSCPYCEEKTPKKQRENDKFKHHAYICRKNEKNCGFTTKNPRSPLEFIDNSDSVAAYNIAKFKN